MLASLPLTATLAPLRRYKGNFDASRIARVHREALSRIRQGSNWRECRALLRALNHQRTSDLSLISNKDVVSFTADQGLDRQKVDLIIQELIPWRTGPFDVAGYHIDSEWRSDIKWKRIAPLLSRTPGQKIADIGSSNGFFLFKLLELSPEIAVGLDPIDRCWLQFAFLNMLSPRHNLAFIPAGLAELRAFPSFFDLILCMGVIYHQRDPFTAVRALYEATKPGGIVILESLVVDREGPYLLVPRERYAKMRNAWSIPTADALASFMERAGFDELTIHRFGAISTQEQRTTVHAPYESLADFLDPKDSSLTVEGYPAPHSAVVVGKKP